MTLLLTKLPSLEAEQFNLPGLPDFLLSPAWLPHPFVTAVQVPDLPSPGLHQLHFGANQEPLTEQPSKPCQLPLLPDPPVWEAEPPAAPARRPRKRGPAKKRANTGLSPGQLPLF
jgi:hypothetical protein